MTSGVALKTLCMSTGLLILATGGSHVTGSGEGGGGGASVMRRNFWSAFDILCGNPCIYVHVYIYSQLSYCGITIRVCVCVCVREREGGREGGKESERVKSQ